MPEDADLYLPILVGAKKNWRPSIWYQRDDQGLNISDYNPNYSELTAIYWAWKNLKDVDAIGLVHYRRFFFKGHKKRKISNVLSHKEDEALLKKSGILLPKKRRYYIETNYSHYIHAHHRLPIDTTRDVILENYPDYLKYFDQVMSRRSAHMFNMFIMKKVFFDNYCDWLFDLLKKVGKRIDIEDYSTQEKRVFGYLSELLMDVWISKNDLDYSEINWQMLGKQDLLRKIYFFLKRKFGCKTQTHF